MKKRYLIYIVIITFLLAISFNIYNKRNIPLKEIYSFKKPFVLGKDLYINDFYNENLFSKDENINSYQTEDKFFPYKRLSKEQAKEDVDYLMKELEDKYTLYKIINSLGELDLARDRIYNEIYDGMTSKELEIILLRHLKYIDDSHFTINKRKLKPNFITQVAEGVIINNIENEYYIGNEKIKNIEALKEYIKPSINSQGEIIYRLFFKKKRINEKQVQEITLENNKKIDLVWKSTNNLNHDTLEPEYYENENYAALRIKEFYHPEDEIYQRYIIDKVSSLAKKDYQILDLRGNHGGNGVLASGIFYTYSGNKPLYSHDSIINVNINKFYIEGYAYDINLIKSHLKFMGYERVNDNTFILRKSDKMYRKKEPLFILVDGSTSSASEHLIDMFKHMTNSILVGIPTSGTMKSSSVYNVVLNNSYISVNFGNMYVHYNNKYFKEFYGFEPDIWIESEFAEENIIEFINKLINENN